MSSAALPPPTINESNLAANITDSFEDAAQQTQGGLVYVKELSLKLTFSEPYYVSQNVQKDTLTVKVQQSMLELDPLAEFDEEYTQGKVFNQKVVK